VEEDKTVVAAAAVAHLVKAADLVVMDWHTANIKDLLEESFQTL
jgi:hypothetical protein